MALRSIIRMKTVNVLIMAFALAGTLSCLSCSYSIKFTERYYEQYDSTLQAIRTRYERLNQIQPFSLDLPNKELSRIGLEINTDTMRFVYNFQLSDRSFPDTLNKYGLDLLEVSYLIRDMQTVQATWISKLDYYVQREKRYLIFLSVRHQSLKKLLQPERYFTLAFFDRPQLFDKKGRLLDRDDLKTHRRINGEIFRRLTDQVFFAVLDKYK
ncbi:MAG: hypothetical protein ACK4E0_17485 [Chitinophagaceae bacterium]